MAFRRPDDKPLYEPMMVRLPTHIRVTRSQWVKAPAYGYFPFELHTNIAPNDPRKDVHGACYGKYLNLPLTDIVFKTHTSH